MPRSRRLAVAVAAVVLALSTAASGRQQAVFTSGVEAVRVDALVLDGKRIVTSLGPADFEVRDNGVPQAIDLVRLEHVPLYVVFVLDASESVTGDRLTHLRAACLAAIDGLGTGDQAAMLTFNQDISLVSARTGDLAALRAGVERIRPGGGTGLYDAVHAGLAIGHAAEARTLVLVFTDGADTTSYLGKQAVRDTARRGDAVVYVALEGERTPFLDQVSAETGGSVSKISSTKDLPDLFARIMQEFRQRYLIGYTPRGVAAAGWHRLDVRVKGRSYSVRARAGYQVGR